MTHSNGYHRYHILTRPAPDVAPWPPRFHVRVNRLGLARLLLREFVHYRGDMKVVLSRPCLYGVFFGPVGGFAPREQFCVGCLRCTTEYPDVVQILPHPEHQRLGDSFLTPQMAETIAQEARTGMVPVRGQGYRGPFGGSGWDGMWTDMSEIVRPTRDGIHGREFISTVVDIGARPAYLTFDEQGRPTGHTPHVLSISLPLLLDMPPVGVQAREELPPVWAQAAETVDSLALLPLAAVLRAGLRGMHVAPVLKSTEMKALEGLDFTPRLLELDGWDEAAFAALRARFPESVIAVRIPFASHDLRSLFEQGVRVFHLVADFHGRLADGRFVMDGIREVHRTFVEAGLRDQVTLIGSGGVVMAEHVPKAIILGLDAVALDTPPLVALQARFEGECADRAASRFSLPPSFPAEWAVQRLVNLMGSWRDQLLEILGAMGLREVRRLRGEIGRAMFQSDLEREAFAEIEGYVA